MNSILLNMLTSRRIQLDIYICKHCNLKCRYCSRFCNIADKEFYEYSDLIRDLSILKKKNINLSNLIITGGEPLLHPDLDKILIAMKEMFPDNCIILHTNGKDFLRQADRLIPIMKNKIHLYLSEYRKTNIDYDAIHKLCNENKIYYYDVWQHHLYQDEIYFSTQKLCIKKKSVYETLDNYLKRCDNTCICLWKGKLYHCGKAACVDILNKKYSTKFEITDKDVLDINDIQSTEQILKFVQLPSPFCKYCFNQKQGEEDTTCWSNDKALKSDWILEKE